MNLLSYINFQIGAYVSYKYNTTHSVLFALTVYSILQSRVIYGD